MSNREILTFGKFGLHDCVMQIGGGILPEMVERANVALSTEPTVEEMGELIGVYAPNKLLQDNISGTVGIFHSREEALTTTRDWAIRSRLLDPFIGAYMNPSLAVPDHFDTAVITGGVANWELRRLSSLGTCGKGIGRIILAGSARIMSVVESNKVRPGMTEIDFLTQYGQEMLGTKDAKLVIHTTDSTNGEDVATEVAQKYYLGGDTTILFSNAGAWMQNAGQLQRAIRAAGSNRPLFVWSDGFKLGVDGTEDKATFQNPLTTPGMILRGIQEFIRHKAHN